MAVSRPLRYVYLSTPNGYKAQLLTLFFLLLVTFLPLFGRQFLVDCHDVLDGLGAFPEVQRTLRLVLVERGRGTANDDGGLGIPTKRLLENPEREWSSYKI